MNQQQFLRRWARDNHQAHGPVVLLEEERRALAECIAASLAITDAIWERASGRKLTEAEKFGEKSA